MKAKIKNGKIYLNKVPVHDVKNGLMAIFSQDVEVYTTNISRADIQAGERVYSTPKIPNLLKVKVLLTPPVPFTH